MSTYTGAHPCPKKYFNIKMAIRVWLSPRDVCALMATQSAVRRIKAMLAQSLQVSVDSPEVLFAMASFSKFYNRFYNACVGSQDPDALDRHRLVKVPRLVYLLLKSLGFCIFQTEDGEAPLMGPGGYPVCAFGGGLSTIFGSSPKNEIGNLKAQLTKENTARSQNIQERLHHQTYIRQVEDNEKIIYKNAGKDATSNDAQRELHRIVLNKAGHAYAEVVRFNNIITKIDDRIAALKEKLAKICHTGTAQHDMAITKLDKSFQLETARHDKVINDESLRFKASTGAYEKARRGTDQSIASECQGVNTEYTRPRSISEEIHRTSASKTDAYIKECNALVCGSDACTSPEEIDRAYRKRSIGSHPDKATPGNTRVVFDGLLSNPSLNGKSGVMTDQPYENGKVHVKLNDGSVKLVSPERLILKTKTERFDEFKKCRDALKKKHH